MKQIITFIFIVIFYCGCQNNKSTKGNTQKTTNNDSIIELKEISYPIIIDKKKKYENKGFVDLREVGNIEYIKLETKDNCLVPGKIRFQGACLDEENIFISTHQQIFRFNKKGKFINSIGKIGQGPGEILSLSDFKINEKTKVVFILDHVARRILSFDYNGILKESITVEKYCSSFEIIEKDMTLCFNNISNNRPIIFSISSTLGNIISEIVPVRKEKAPKRILMAYYTQNKTYNNKYIYNTYLTDTIFCIDKKTLKVEPRYILIPPNTDSDEKKTLPFLLFETSKYTNILIDNGISNSKETHIIDKKNNQIFTGLFADYEKGTAVMPINTNKDNILVDLYEAPGLKSLLSKNLLNGSLKEIAKSLDDEDNPVLVLISSN